MPQGSGPRTYAITSNPPFARVKKAIADHVPKFFEYLPSSTRRQPLLGKVASKWPLTSPIGADDSYCRQAARGLGSGASRSHRSRSCDEVECTLGGAPTRRSSAASTP